MARWANRTAWLNRANWSFADFIGGPNDLIISAYNAWSHLAMELLTVKSKPRADAVEREFKHLVHLLEQGDLAVDVRLDVITTVAGLGTPEAKGVLQNVLQSEKDERIIGNIKYYLSMIDTRDKI